MGLKSFFSSGDLFHPSTWGGYDPIGEIEGWGNDLYQKVTGHPDDVKKAYDAAIAASQQNAGQLRDFLMQGKGQAQQYYAPLQHMFQSAYGTDGIKPPVTPTAQNPFQSAFGRKP